MYVCSSNEIAARGEHPLRRPPCVCYYTLAVLVYKVLRGCEPSYLSPFSYVADLPTVVDGFALPAATASSSLRFTCSTVGSRAVV